MIYTFKHPDKEEYIDVNQGINDVHEYIDGDGVKWERVFSSPQVSMSTSKMDPFSKAQYLEKTRDQKGTVGDLMDRSQELSDKRAQICGGVDPVKKKFLDDYAQKRGGKRHHSEKRSIKNKGISVDFGD